MRTQKLRDAYTRKPTRFNGREWPRGPLGLIESGPTAIGYCRLCGANARRTTVVRGMFNCPDCYWQWVDTRVGEIPRGFDDYWSEA